MRPKSAMRKVLVTFLQFKPSIFPCRTCLTVHARSDAFASFAAGASSTSSSLASTLSNTAVSTSTGGRSSKSAPPIHSSSARRCWHISHTSRWVATTTLCAGDNEFAANSVNVFVSGWYVIIILCCPAPQLLIGLAYQLLTYFAQVTIDCNRRFNAYKAFVSICKLIPIFHHADHSSDPASINTCSF